MRLLKKGTDYSVPRRKALVRRGSVAVDRAVCPLFQHRQMHADKALYVCIAALSLAQELPRAGVKEPAAGEILVATMKSHDPDLARSVILLIQYDRDGAIGLMLNRPNGKAFEGGPIELGVRTLVRSRSKPEGAQRIFGDVYVYPRMVESSGARVYVGYTGWSAQQLKDEIARGLWKVAAGDSRVVFDRDPATLWKRLKGKPG